MGKNNEVKLRVSKEELEKLTKKAKELGLPVGTYLRLTGLKSKVKVE